MYAVILTGGKQYYIKEGEIIKVEKIAMEEGHSVTFDKVLMVSDGINTKLGRPYLDNIFVEATIKSHGLRKKVSIIKFRRRKHYCKMQGHRQQYTELLINSINNSKLTELN